MRIILLTISFLFIILVVRFIFFFSNVKTYKTGEQVEFDYILLDEPKMIFGKQFVWINNISIFFASSEEFHYGDTVRIKGKISERRVVSKKNNELIKEKIIENPLVLKQNKGVDILSVIAFVRQKISNTVASYLNKNEAALLIGIVFGIRKDFDKEFLQAFRDTGVLHVIAASGTNVSMAGAFLLSMFSVLVKRRFAVIFTVLGILFYVVFSGMQPSIVRAGLMGIFAYGALFFGRQNYSLLALSFALFIMLFFDPQVLFDVGFQLSFLSTIGIILIKPVLDARLFFGKKFLGFEDLSTTFSAQLATIPIMLSAFSSYSFISLPVNALVLWTVPIVMVLGGVGSLVGLIHPAISAPFLFLCYPLLLYFEKITVFFAEISMPFTFETVPIFFVAGYYCLLLSMIMFLKKKERRA